MKRSASAWRWLRPALRIFERLAPDQSVPAFSARYGRGLRRRLRLQLRLSLQGRLRQARRPDNAHHSLGPAGVLGGRRWGRRVRDRGGFLRRRLRPPACLESLRSLSLDRRKTRIDLGHPRLSIVRQCELASISCSSFYREPTAENEETRRLMRLIDEQFLETPWYGSRQMARHLRGADPPAPEDQRTASAASDMALSASPSDHRPAEPGLVRRRDLHPDAQRLPVHRRDHALVQPKGSDVETIEHRSQPTMRSLKPITQLVPGSRSRRSTPSPDSLELFSGTTCWRVRTSVFVTPSFAVYPFLAPHTVRGSQGRDRHLLSRNSKTSDCYIEVTAGEDQAVIHRPVLFPNRR
jgi:hypothetical protein